MQAQDVASGTMLTASRSRPVAAYRTALWLALLTYPLVPGMLFRSRNLVGASPVLAALCLLLSYAWSISGPIAAWLTLYETDRGKVNRREQPQIAREAILAAIGAPFFVLTAAVLAWFHWTTYQTAIWYALLAGVASARFLPPPESRPAVSETMWRLHHVSALLLLVFGVAHVGNHLAAVESLSAHVTVQNILRVVYRQPVIETVIAITALLQVWTGWMLVSRARWQRATRLRNTQLLAGAFLGMFFVSHLTGVFISGRLIQNADTTFAWATGGPAGLLSNPRSPQMIPYYSLAVLALVLHAGSASRWSLAPVLGQLVAQRICYALIALGIIVTLVLLLPMSGFHLA